jgi:hypothetical protein
MCVMSWSRLRWPWRSRRHVAVLEARDSAERASARVPVPRRPDGSLSARLIDRWCAGSLATGWATPGGWWTPAIDAVVEAVLDDGDYRSACAELARQRALRGCSLAETIDDIGALFAAARLGTPPYEITRAVALAWAEAAQASIEAAGCVNATTGLGTAAHVEARLAEMYAEGRKYGYSPSETHSLVVVELSAVGQIGDPWDDALRISDVAECLRTVFDGGQTMGLTGPGRVVVIVPRAADLPRTIDGVRRMLHQWRRVGVGSPGALIWVESLPVGQVAAERLLSTLCV